MKDPSKRPIKRRWQTSASARCARPCATRFNQSPHARCAGVGGGHHGPVRGRRRLPCPLLRARTRPLRGTVAGSPAPGRPGTRRRPFPPMLSGRGRKGRAGVAAAPVVGGGSPARGGKRGRCDRNERRRFFGRGGAGQRCGPRSRLGLSRAGWPALRAESCFCPRAHARSLARLGNSELLKAQFRPFHGFSVIQ